MIKKFLTMFGIIIFLAGCGLTSEGDFARETIRTKGKKAAAVSLENSEWYMCRAASVGAVKDRYGVSMDKVAAYNIICKQDLKFTPIIPNPSMIFREEVPEDPIS